MGTTRKSTQCPYCDGSLRTVAMACDTCDVEIKGRFQQNHFARLSPEDQAFLEQYLLSGFSMKTLAANSDLGYVAIRNRLDRVIAHYKQLLSNEEAKHAILARVEEGELTAAEAAERIGAL